MPRQKHVKVQFFNNENQDADQIAYLSDNSPMFLAVHTIQAVQLPHEGDEEGTLSIFMKDEKTGEPIIPNGRDRKIATILENQWSVALDHVLFDCGHFFGNLHDVYTDWAIQSTQHKADLIKTEWELWGFIFKFKHESTSYVKTLYKTRLNAWVASQIEWKLEDYHCFIGNNIGSKLQQELWRYYKSSLSEGGNPFYDIDSGLNSDRSNLIDICHELMEIAKEFEKRQSSENIEIIQSNDHQFITRDKYKGLKHGLIPIWNKYLTSINQYLHTLRDGFYFENEVVIPCVKFKDGLQVLGHSDLKRYVFKNPNFKKHSKRSALRKVSQPIGWDFLTDAKSQIDLSILSNQLRQVGATPTRIVLSVTKKQVITQPQQGSYENLDTGETS